MVTHDVLLTIALAPLLSGCGILIGNTKPVAEKSDHYLVVELHKKNKNWIKVPHEKNETHDDNSQSDVIYQSRVTATIISLNSTCRRRFEIQGLDLTGYTNTLLLGFTDVTARSQTLIKVSSYLALKTVLEGKIDNQSMKIQAIVLRSHTCIYDLMYVSKPQHFMQDSEVFARFVASLRIK